MVSPKYPPKGAPAKRRVDGLIGEVYVSSPAKDLVAVRWSADGESGTFLYSAEHFARDWELTATSASNWKGRTAATALLVILGICLYGGLRRYEPNPASPRPSTPPQQDSPAALADPKALLDKYGAIAASECSRGADEFVRSVASRGFKWEDVGIYDEKFNEYLTVYVAPGVTTSISDKLLVQDGFGVFKRVKLFCSYDTQKKQVLQYWIADSDE